MWGGLSLMRARESSAKQPRGKRFVSARFVCLLFLENAVDRRVEQRAVAGDVEAAGVGQAADFVEPAGAIGLAAHEFDVRAQRRVAAGKVAFGGAVNIADRLETFDGAD